MALAVVVLVIALAVGAARDGSAARLAAIPLRRRWLVLLAVVAQVVAGVSALAGSRAGYDAGLAVSAVALGAFCWGNGRVPGVMLIAAGLVLNAVVVVLNGAMPVSAAAAARAGASVGTIAAGHDPRHTMAGQGTTARWLGDVVPVALPGWRQVDSPGDIAVAAGLAEFVVVGMGRDGRRRTPPEARATGRHRAEPARPAA